MARPSAPRHFVRPSRLRGLYSVVGGKLTTYRALSEQVVDLIFRSLGKTSPPCRTAAVPLPRAAAEDFEAFRSTFETQSTLPPASTARLVRLYGVRAAEVL